MMRLPAAMVLMVCSVASAQVSVSSPTNGNYRIGEHAAVRIETPAGETVMVTGRGLLPVRIEARGQRISATVPMLVLDTPGDELKISVDGATTSAPMTWRAIGAEERIVGVVGDVLPKAREMFAGKSVTPIQLAAARPLAGSAAAWDVLDGVVIDGMAQLDEETVRFGLAKGMKFAVRSPQAPDATWPWERQGDWWRLEYEPLGPKVSISDSAYAPVRNWSPGALKRTRYNAIFLGALFAILATGASLLRGRVRIAVLVIVVAGAIGALLLFSRRQPPLREAGAAVVVLTDQFVQTDVWEYQTSVRPTVGVVAMNGLTRPVPLSLEHAHRLDVQLECAADGRPLLFRTRPAPGRIMCFYTSAVNPKTSELMPLPTTQSPLRTLVPIFYAAPGARVTGEGTGGDSVIPYRQQWRSVIVDRR